MQDGVLWSEESSQACVRYSWASSEVFLYVCMQKVDLIRFKQQPGLLLAFFGSYLVLTEPHERVEDKLVLQQTFVWSLVIPWVKIFHCGKNNETCCLGGALSWSLDHIFRCVSENMLLYPLHKENLCRIGCLTSISLCKSKRIWKHGGPFPI